tara:strand:+ start:3582 stop:3800 length:219 start_codon:yes stop_codon:yes gene_type:complete
LKGYHKMRNILAVYILFAYAFLNITVGFWTISFADTTVLADMQTYDTLVCGIGSIFILWGMMIVGTIVFRKR